MDGRGTLVLMNPDGGEPRQLLVDQHRNRMPSFRPGGDRIVFQSNRGNGLHFQLFEIGVASRELRQLSFERMVVMGSSVSASDTSAR